MLVISLLVYNQWDVTRNCIESVLLNTKGPYLLLLVDNASRIDTAENLKAVANKHAHVRYIRNDENVGYIKAHNAMFRQYESDFFCVLNNDVVIRERAWDEMFIERFAANAQLAIAGPRQLCGRLNDEGIGSPRLSEKCDYIEGWCLFVRTAIIRSCLPDLFDQTYLTFAFCEDSDLSLRLRQKGFTISEFSDINIQHLHNVTFQAEKVNGRPHELHNRGILTKRWKHYLKSRDFKVPFTILIKQRGALGNLPQVEGIVDELLYEYPGCAITIDSFCRRIHKRHPLSLLIGEDSLDLQAFDEIIDLNDRNRKCDHESVLDHARTSVDTCHAHRQNNYIFECNSCRHQLGGGGLAPHNVSTATLIKVRGYCRTCLEKNYSWDRKRRSWVEYRGKALTEVTAESRSLLEMIRSLLYVQKM
jgi:GT2 family glycosyltransferase